MRSMSQPREQPRPAEQAAGPCITTQCKGRNDELVYSRFHYATDDRPQNSVLDLLGVLIKPPPTSPSTSNTQRVTVNDAYFYNPPDNDRIFLPMDTAMGFTQGYSTGPNQNLDSTAHTYDHGVIDVYLSCTWVTDRASRQTKSDRRFTRIVILGTGISHTKDDNCSYTEGPKIQSDYFNGEWGKLHMFVDGKDPDGRAIPNNWGLRQQSVHNLRSWALGANESMPDRSAAPQAS